MSYQKEYRESIENPEAFWSRQAELINGMRNRSRSSPRMKRVFITGSREENSTRVTWPSISMWKTGGPSRRL